MAKAQYILEVLLGASTSNNYRRTLNNAAKSLDSIDSTAKRVTRTVAAVFAAANIKQAVTDAVSVYADFEQAMANSAAIAQATASEYEMLEDAARAAGRSTTMTATESAEAIGYMALAGWDAAASAKALTPVLKMAEATGAELQTTSDLVTDSMSAAGIEIGGLQDYLDKLVMGNNKANTTAGQLMEALIKTGGSARSLGADLDDTITALGILANNGLKGAEAGTALNSILTRLAANSNARDRMEALGISIFDAKGKFIGLEETIKNISGALSKMTAEEQTGVLKDIAGVHYYSQMTYLLDAVKQGADGTAGTWEKLEDNIVNSTGSLERMNAEITDTLPAAWARLQSAVDDAKISLVDVFAGDAKDFLNWMAGKIPDITDSITAFAEEHRGGVLDALEGAGAVMEQAWGAVKNISTWLVDHKSAVVGTLTAIGSAMFVSKGVNAATSIISFLSGITPAAAGVMAASGVVGVLAGITSEIRRANEQIREDNLAEHFGSISLSLDELDGIAKDIVGRDSLNTVTAMLSAMGETAGGLENVREAAEKINKMSWKLNAGFEFDSQAYQTAVETYIEQAQSLLSSRGYEVRVAATLLFGAESEQVAESDKFYSSLDAKLAGWKGIIQKRMDSFLSDGVISVNEEKIINNYLEKINRITNAIEQAQRDAEGQASFDRIKLKYNGADLDPDSFRRLAEDIHAYVEQQTEAAGEAYESAMSSLYERLELDKDFTQQDLEAGKNEALEAYYRKKAESLTGGMDYIIESINTAYPEVAAAVETARENLNSSIESIFNGDLEIPVDQLMNAFSDAAYDAIESTGLSSADRAALSSLVDDAVSGIAGEMESLRSQMEKQGMDVPQSLADGISNETALAAVSGSFDDMYALMGDEVDANNPEAAAVIKAAEQIGFDIPDKMSGQINAGASKVQSAVSAIRTMLESGLSGNLYLRTSISASYTAADAANWVKMDAYSNRNAAPKSPASGINVWANAEGGIYDRPILTTFAEEGPEAAVPLDGSSRAKSLWLQAGQILGMFGGRDAQNNAAPYQALPKTGAESIRGTDSGIKIEIINNITVNGSAAESDIKNALQQSMEGLEEKIRSVMADVAAEQRRTAFT